MRIRFSLGRFLRMPSCALWLVYFLFFLSGISGLMYEVVWLRMLSRILGNTVYAASTVLAAFMAGLALGSFLIGQFIDRARRPLLWYGPSRTWYRPDGAVLALVAASGLARVPGCL